MSFNASILTCVKVIGKTFNQAFNTKELYNILEPGCVETIDNEIAISSGGTIIGKNAYIEALLLKKAGLVSLPEDKLSLFKTGRIKLETEHASHSGNVEWYFLHR
jgi:hypothetical protein